MANFRENKDYIFTRLCKNFEQFQIPNFQRPYAWQNKQLQEFWYSIISNDYPYFIGNLVAISQAEGEPLLIIDGQQRITTIFLMLAAIRDTYLALKNETRNTEDIKAIEDRIATVSEYIFFRDPTKPDERIPRLKLGKESYQETFDTIMRGRPVLEYEKLDQLQRRFYSNHTTIFKFINEYIESSKLSRLIELQEKVLKLQFITIILSSNEDVYDIFEGFNSTGLGLTPVDLIKNALLKGTNSDKEIQDEVEYLWRELERGFEDTDASKFTKFIRYYWIVKHEYISNSNLFKAVKDKEIFGKKPIEIKKFVEDLLTTSRIYLGMIYSPYQEFLKVSEVLLIEFLKFKMLKNEQIYEVLISIYLKIEMDDKLQEKHWKTTLKNLWIFIVRSRFSEINPSTYERLFADFCKKLRNTHDKKALVILINEFSETLFTKVSSESEFINHFNAEISYLSDKKLITQTISDIMENDHPEIQLRNPTVEHILPQNPLKWGYDAKDIDGFVNRIGNLTLLNSTDNSYLCKDNTLEIKCSVYKKSKFKLNNEIESQWKESYVNNPEDAIEKRGVEISKKIENIWRVQKLTK